MDKHWTPIAVKATVPVCIKGANCDSTTVFHFNFELLHLWCNC